MMRCAGALTLLLLAPCLRADLQTAKSEQNLERRSGLALANAARALKEARAAYSKGDEAQVAVLVKEILESVELAETSLEATGKNPRKSPKWFKHAEIETRDLLKHLEAFQQDMDMTDRPLLDPVKTKVQQVHDDMLLGVMEGKHK